MGLCLDLCYLFWGWGKFSFKITFFFEWGWFYLEFLGNYFLKFFLNFFSLCFVVELYSYLFNIHSFIQFFSCIWGKCKCWAVCFFVFGQQQLNNCCWKTRVALRRASWVDFAGWTGWEVLTVHDEWKRALVMVLAEVERVKMVVVCQSGGTAVHWESLQSDWIIQRC